MEVSGQQRKGDYFRLCSGPSVNKIWKIMKLHSQERSMPGSEVIKNYEQAFQVLPKSSRKFTVYLKLFCVVLRSCPASNPIHFPTLEISEKKNMLGNLNITL